jgi:hypothetical protein
MKRAAGDPAHARAATARRESSGAASPLALVTGAAAILWAAVAAFRQTWLCDDAFISFRYADNLTHGLGLVYNAGERVEGYSNFLWTLWTALGMRLGVAPEAWSVAWGLCFYVATLVLLLVADLRPDARGGNGAPAARKVTRTVPLACLLAAAHPDWQRYATGGLETSHFTFLVTAGTLLATRRSGGARGLAAAGFVFALAALTRPDGPLFAPLVALWVWWARRPRGASLAAFLGAFLCAWLPYVIWKVAYYGDFFPNTFYAKSANLAWYSQGWVYVTLYFRRYWILALALVVAPVAVWRGRARTEPARDLVLALGLGVAYTAYVLRVGGDFMYARLLIPAAPLLILAFARGVEELLADRSAAQWAVAIAAAAAVALTPNPIRDQDEVRGIVNESRFYSSEVQERRRRQGLTLRRYFDGLPVHIAIAGSQAALAYYARPALVIEGGAGLTDRWIAHRPLLIRRRVGHEKVAPLSYLLERRVHFTIQHFAAETFALDSRLPPIVAWFDSIPGRVVHLDPPLMDSLRIRGASFPDVPAVLDSDIRKLDASSDDQVRSAYEKLKPFYFDFVPDSARERPFLERLERGQGGRP